jgi:hypothetical protein
MQTRAALVRRVKESWEPFRRRKHHTRWIAIGTGVAVEQFFAQPGDQIVLFGTKSLPANPPRETGAGFFSFSPSLERPMPSLSGACEARQLLRGIAAAASQSS